MDIGTCRRLNSRFEAHLFRMICMYSTNSCTIQTKLSKIKPLWCDITYITNYRATLNLHTLENHFRSLVLLKCRWNSTSLIEFCKANECLFDMFCKCPTLQSHINSSNYSYLYGLPRMLHKPMHVFFLFFLHPLGLHVSAVKKRLVWSANSPLGLKSPNQDRFSKLP